MKNTKPEAPAEIDPDRDTMRPEYDFSKGVRGATAARYREGTNIVILDPEVMNWELAHTGQGLQRIPPLE